MNRQSLVEAIKAKQSMLCVGLDVHPGLLPTGFEQTPEAVLKFNKAIIDATLPFTVSYKINSAFYESFGLEGWKVLGQTFEYLQNKGVFIIADAKRGDIGNTSEQYAKAFLHQLQADAITVAPYMGFDSVKPFLNIENKWTILLGLTSNAGSEDFQLQKLSNGKYLFEEVLAKAVTWGNPENLMFVVGATQADRFKQVRAIAGNHFLLVPGIGAQGGDLESTLEAGMIDDFGLLINASRSIIFASKESDYAAKAEEAAKALQQEMGLFLDKKANQGKR
jgi:orotidine-5'-phosphate decarboxylase